MALGMVHAQLRSLHLESCDRLVDTGYAALLGVAGILTTLTELRLDGLQRHPRQWERLRTLTTLRWHYPLLIQIALTRCL